MLIPGFFHSLQALITGYAGFLVPVNQVTQASLVCVHRKVPRRYIGIQTLVHILRDVLLCLPFSFLRKSSRIVILVPQFFFSSNVYTWFWPPLLHCCEDPSKYHGYHPVFWAGLLTKSFNNVLIKSSHLYKYEYRAVILSLFHLQPFVPFFFCVWKVSVF